MSTRTFFILFNEVLYNHSHCIISQISSSDIREEHSRCSKEWKKKLLSRLALSPLEFFPPTCLMNELNEEGFYHLHSFWNEWTNLRVKWSWCLNENSELNFIQIKWQVPRTQTPERVFKLQSEMDEHCREKQGM